MAVMTELCEFESRPVSERSSRSNDRYLVKTNFRSWPIAV